jgi:hypothetical protein
MTLDSPFFQRNSSIRKRYMKLLIKKLHFLKLVALAWKIICLTHPTIISELFFGFSYLQNSVSGLMIQCCRSNQTYSLGEKKNKYVVHQIFNRQALYSQTDISRLFYRIPKILFAFLKFLLFGSFSID